MIRRSPRSTLFPNTTLFRSNTARANQGSHLRPACRSQQPLESRGERRARQRVLDVKHLNIRRWHTRDRKSTRLNSSHANISYAVFCLKTKDTTPVKQHYILP